MLAFDHNDNLLITWQQRYEDYPEIYLQRWEGTSWEEVGENSAQNGGISNTFIENKFDAVSPSIKVSPTGIIYIGWISHERNSTEWDYSSYAYLKQWNGNSWIEVGAGSASNTGVAFLAGNSNRFTVTMSMDIGDNAVIRNMK